MTRALRLPVFRQLLIAYALNELAWSVGTVALSVLVYRRTGSAIGTSAFFLCSQFAPALLSPALVARIDRRPPRIVLPALYALEAVLFGALAWMTQTFSLGPMLVLVLADGLVAITARALASATRADILKPAGLLPEGNALSNAVFSFCFMAGPLLGGAAVVAGGTVAALLINCALFAGMSVVLATAHLPGSARERGPSAGRLRAALAHARRDRPLGMLLALQGIGIACFTISVPVEVVFAQHTLHAGAGGYGALLSAWGAGAVAGSAAYARWRRRSTALLVGAGSLALGIGFVIMGLAPSLVVAMGGAAIGGFGNSIEWIAVRTWVQDRAPEQWMALIMSLAESIGQVAPGIGIILGGVITVATNARVALVVAGVGSITFACAAVIVLARDARRGGRSLVADEATVAGDEEVVASGHPEPAGAVTSVGKTGQESLA